MLWRLLYESAARADSVVALNIENLDLPNKRGKITAKGGTIRWVHWQSVRRALSSCLGQGRRAAIRLDLRVAGDCVSRLASDGCI
jgi:hypothetical protein